MALITRNPFALLNEMNRIFDNSLYPSGERAALATPDWAPAVDIHEDAQAFHVAVDLPGIKPENIEITAHNGVLSIRGSREVVNEDKQQKRSERVFGSFLREFSMPESADLERVEAKTENGVLNIVVPKAPKAEPKRITVQ